MQSADQLKQSLIGELLALIAHDLRNPLSALHSNLGFLKAVEEFKDPDVLEAFEDGFVSCDGLNHIIDNLDLLGHALRGDRFGDGIETDVVDVVREVTQRSEQAARSHGVVLGLDVGETSVRATLRRDLTARAVSNVVRNAIQHATGSRRVRVAVGVTESGAEIRVDDTGARASLELPLFSAEGQIASKSIPHGRYSRGLGLYCARIAAQADGWELQVAEAPPPFGNRFVLHRPQA